VCWSGQALPPVAGPSRPTLGSTLLARSRATRRPRSTTCIASMDLRGRPGLEGVNATVNAPVHRVGGSDRVYVRDAERREWQERDIALISEIANRPGRDRAHARAADCASPWMRPQRHLECRSRYACRELGRTVEASSVSPDVPVTLRRWPAGCTTDRVHVTARLGAA
jgi:hypothetical protein